MDLAAIDHVLTTTRAVRKRLDPTRPVALETIHECIGIAMQAPAGSNLAALHWIVVTDPGRRGAVADAYARAIGDREHPSMLAYKDANAAGFESADPAQQERMIASVRHLVGIIADIPALVVPCYRATLPAQLDLFVTATIFGSAVPAVWSFQLALRSRGLASVYTTAHLVHGDDVAAALGIPAGVLQIALIPVAHPIGTEFRPARRRRVEEVVHHDRW